MSNFSIDPDRVVRDSGGQKLGTADYSGQVRDGWQEKGKIENDRYTDEFGRDRGWVSRTSSSGGGSGFLFILAVILTFGIFYLIYKGLKWLIDQGNISTAHASRSWGIISLLFPPLFFLALSNGYSALRSLNQNGDPQAQKDIANAGIFLGYVGLVLCIMLVIGLASR